MLSIKLVRQNSNESYLSCLDEIEYALISNNKIELTVTYSDSNIIKDILFRALGKFVSLKLIKTLCLKGGETKTLSILMGASFNSLIPHFLFSSNNFVYMYDGWPRFHKLIVKNASFLNIRMIFFSSYKVSCLFNELNTTIKSVWIPEGINVQNYYYSSFLNKDIDVIEFGRMYDRYHTKIVKGLADNNKKHIYEKHKGELAFTTRADFIDGLSRSKISICIPSNITHPERAENISSMTLRYLQSMASKCLIVGMMPDEMKLLFDYIPIIEINMDDASAQIIDILNNYESYIPLINKNYAEIKRSHTWNIRIQKISEVIENESRK